MAARRSQAAALATADTGANQGQAEPTAGYWRVTHVWLVSGQSLKTHGGMLPQPIREGGNTKLTIEAGSLVIERTANQGHKQRIQVPLSAVVLESEWVDG